MTEVNPIYSNLPSFSTLTDKLSYQTQNVRFNSQARFYFSSLGLYNTITLAVL